MTRVLGIDLAAGRGRTELAVLELIPGSVPPVFNTVDHTPVASDDEIVAAVEHCAPSVIAIDAPLTLPRAVADALQGNPTHQPPSSPYTRAAERSPFWAQIGVRPLPVSFLGGLTFRAIALVPRLRAAAPSTPIIEVFPTAALRLLGIASREPATPHVKRLSKTAEMAREQVQRGLAAHIANLPDPTELLFTADLLDALAAALTGAAYMVGTYLSAGDEDEGQIILPRPSKPDTASTPGDRKDAYRA